MTARASGLPWGPSDLHLHSNHSDGTEHPAEVVAAAHRHGVRTMALTDHDTTTGWVEAAEAAVSLGMAMLPGIELSARHGWHSVHVLGYLFDPGHAAIVAVTDRVRDARRGRVRTMADRIARDYDLTWDDIVAQTADGATIGRPHIADALVARGIVADRRQAFDGILHPESPYYIEHDAPTPLEAVRVIVAAGGVPIIAHPAARDGLLPARVTDELLDAGLAGFELGHRENLPGPTARLRRLCAERDLIVTGSSDYHGAGKQNLPGENTTADDMVERIVERATGSAPILP